MKLSASQQKGIVMSQCSYCGQHHGGHAVGCPVYPRIDEDKMRKWKCGYEDGRAGKLYWSSDPSYMHGSTRGVIALETAENEGPRPH